MEKCCYNHKYCPTPPPLPQCCNKECLEQEHGNLRQCQSQGDLSASQGDQSQSQGDQSENQGNLAASQGDQSQSQGDQAETQGDLAASQGDQSQSQGDQSESQGDLSASQGDQSQSQGDLEGSLGDLNQTQGGETQGDQTQGNQTHGDQTQNMTGHGGQTLGDQTLSSSPNISTPVNVSGVNVNVTVSCCDEHKKHKRCNHDCQMECRRSIRSILSLIKTFSLAITDPTSSQIEFYYYGLTNSPIAGNLGNVTDCTFTVVPESGGNEITFITDVLEALSFEPTANTPNLFSLLLSYLQSLPNFNYCTDDSDESDNFSCDCCYKKIELQLQAYYTAGINLQINLSNSSFDGYIYKISNGIIYMVDDLTDPTVIYAIPSCKILSYQPL